jgi:hypothetical protein
MNIDKFRGGRSIPDLDVKKFWETHSLVSDTILQKDIDYAKIFTDTFDTYIHSSKLNDLRGLNYFPHKTFVSGTSQSFDSFWMRYHNKRFRCFKGEFFYHKANWKKFHKWCYIEDDRINTNDAVVISLPFSDYCTEHPRMREILNDCEMFGVPVLIDCAFYVISKGLVFDLRQYSCIEEVTFSVSKGFYNAERIRAGIRYSKNFRDDNIDMYNEWKHLNHMGAYLGTKLLEEFPPDYAYNKFLGKQMKYCEDNNLVPAHCVSFAFGKEEYKDLNRGTDVNRLCISDQIGDIE